MFDAHCHLQFEAFDADREEALSAAVEQGLTGLIMAGYDEKRRELSRELARRDGLFATAGVHPWAVAEMDDEALDEALKRLERDLEQGGWCGLGELGMDFYRVKDDEGRNRQKRAFLAQLGMARELNLPLVIHAVRCHNSLIQLLRQEGLPEAGGIMHGYSGSPRQVGTFLMLNLDISVGTPLTFSNKERMQEVVRQTPRERLLVETDAPDRPPEGHSGERNELHYLGLVVEEVAKVWECDEKVVAKTTADNARRRFELGSETIGR